MASSRKYISEFSLHMTATYHILLQQDDLHKPEVTEALESYPCHIYLVCRRPRITIDPTIFSVSDQIIAGRFLIHRGHLVEPQDFELRNDIGRSDLFLESQFPHTRFLIRDSDGGLISAGKVANLAHRAKSMEPHRSLEVLYAGQAFGREGSRTARERLLSHSTLQSIYAAALTDAPDQDVWLLLSHFEDMVLANLDPRHKDQIALEEDGAHRQRVLSTEISEQQKINLTEAALIRYFEPEYNKTYKSTFPSPVHETYASCYDLDYNAVSVDIATDQIGTKLWSKKVPASYEHLLLFPLNSREERVSMFDFSSPDT